MATQGNKDIFEVLILLLKVLPNGAELIKDHRFMESLQSNICEQWGPRLKTIVKELVPPTSPKNGTVAVREGGREKRES